MKQKLSLAITSLTYPSHINSAKHIAVELKKRGHDIVYLGFAEAKESVEAAGLPFQVFAEKERGPDAARIRHEALKEEVGIKAFKQVLDGIKEDMAFYLPELVKHLPTLKLDAFIYDQGMFGVRDVLEYLDLPAVEFCSAVAFTLDQAILHPTPFAPYQHYSLNPFYLAVNLSMSYIRGRQLSYSIFKAVNRFRRFHQMKPLNRPIKLFWRKKRKRATIVQLIPELDFPTHCLPKNFFYCGSFTQHAKDKKADFPFDRLSGKPLIYACLGTVQNGRWDLFEMISHACAKFDVQLVLSFGEKGASARYPVKTLAKNTLAVDYAPQNSLISSSVLTITHAGLNTPLEALCAGKPMICIPITHDQPQVAARMQRAGVAEAIPVKKLTQERLITALHKILNTPSYTQRALELKDKLCKAGGVERAADIIETTVRYGEL